MMTSPTEELQLNLPERPSWDHYFVKMARLASTRSKDPSTHIGAVIVGPDNEVISTGYNSFVRGLNDDVPERSERPEKYFWYEHAERNAIYSAARQGTPLKGCRMFLSCWTPCTDCMRAIIQVGIKEIILGTRDGVSGQGKWIEEARRSMEMAKETGVIIRHYEDM
jgi:dCMP deaminase